MVAAPQEGHQQGHGARNPQKAFRCLVGLTLVSALLLAGCIPPPTRNQARDDAIRQSTEGLAPLRREPVDATRETEVRVRPTDDLAEDVRSLSSPVALERIQANNRLRQAGTAGTLAAARFIDNPDATHVEVLEAVQFLADVQVGELDPLDQAEVREALALCLDRVEPEIRAHAARALQIHGPGPQRTRLLEAIGDPERRVRWAVVRRFGEFPSELNETQRSILIGYLDARSRAEFASADVTGSGSVSRSEFPGNDEEFRRLDRNGDGRIELEEWISPYSSGIRADVVQLLQRLHTSLTPDAQPIGYNPYLPSADQLEKVANWRRWNEQLSRAAHQPE
jgi:hypothetical protein